MLRLILGTVTIAAAGYALKEYCETEGCPWDESSYTTTSSAVTNTEEKTVMENSEKAKQFHKVKKAIYKESMKKYLAHLQTYNLVDEDIDPTKKVEKEKFSDEMLNSEIETLISQITETLEILSSNLDLKLRIFAVENKMDADDLQKVKLYVKSIYKLSHLKIFVNNSFVTTVYEVNKNEILETLVQAMPLAMKKESIYVDLSS